ncbi:MAG: superoxide dismutase, partial [Prevotella sp.]|nr:superoxide dismutase [Prevotella sp.]
MSRFDLMTLPFAPEALEPVISRETIALHHGKHLQTYVNNLNAALPGTPYEDMTLEEIVRKADGGIFNNAGQILNHNLYFEALRAPRSENLPKGKIAEAIDGQFGSFEAFQKEFVQKGATLFGSGWVWLSKDKEGKLVI